MAGGERAVVKAMARAGLAGGATMESTIELWAPLPGWVLPLADVPDPVFSAGLAGDGLAIDPTGNTVHAPCAGTVAWPPHGAHAVTLRSMAGELLIHVGIDTVALGGEVFRRLVADGQTVVPGQPLLAFDLDRVAHEAPSVITPIVVSDRIGRTIAWKAAPGRIEIGMPLLKIAVADATPAALPVDGSAAKVEALFRVPFEHGLHARPAARLVAALESFAATVIVRDRDRLADARSPVALMTLGLQRGDTVSVAATGPDAEAALGAVGTLLARVTASPMRAEAPRVAPPTAGSELAAVLAARGLARGEAVLLRWERRVPGPALGDPASEQRRLVAALARVDAALARLASDGALQGVFVAHRALLADPTLSEAARARIAAGWSAGAAWVEAIAAGIRSFAAGGGERLAARHADLTDLEQHVLGALAGEEPFTGRVLPQDAVVLCQDLLPSQLLGLDAARIAAVVTADGGPTAHVAILAAARGLPMLVAAGPALLAIAPGTRLVVDAEAGRVHVAPDDATWQNAGARLAAHRSAAIADRAAATLPAVTLDGVRVHVLANLGASGETAAAVALGAEGCGLLRTEFLFADRATAPSVAEQTAAYAEIALALGGRPLTLRTLDAGSDKPLPYLELPAEPNPALGLRGLRLGLRHPALLDQQLQAVLEGGGVTARVLLPMVTDRSELLEVRTALESRARARGRSCPALGVMIETPAAALRAESLVQDADFVSIGTNDLAQYTLAMDRLNAALANRLDALHPAVLQLIERVARAGRAAGKPVAVCGGLASDTEAVPVLIGLGIGELSVVPALVPRLKALIRRLDSAKCASLASEALALDDAGGVRARLRQWFAEQFPGESP